MNREAIIEESPRSKPEDLSRGRPTLLLELIRDDKIVVALPVYDGAARLGRGSTNDLVLTDPDVSKHHAVVSMDGEDGPCIEDLRSTNGTFVNGERVSGTQPLTDRDLLRLGKTALIRVTVHKRRPVFAPILHDLTSGVRSSLSDRFVIGADMSCDLRLPSGPDVAATIEMRDDGEVWMATPDGDHEKIELGEEFDVEGHRLLLELPGSQSSPTITGAIITEYPYDLTVSLNAPGGPVATLEDPTNGRIHVVTAGNRAVLLYILAKKLVEDRASGVPESDAGWCDDDAVTTGVWGRNPPVGYNVLLHRLRKELKQAGFDPWFVEKRRGAVRARVTKAEVRM